MRSSYAILASVIALGAGTAAAQDLTIGVVPGAYADVANIAAAEAAEQGLTVEVVEFSDWTTPNIALDAGDIDVNFFQHRPFMENTESERGFDFEFVAPGILQNIGLYSLRHDSFDDLPEGGTVAIANDPVNQGRGLLLLERAGLITLREGVGFLGTVDDIIENPKDLQFSEVEGPQLVRVTGDVDLAQGYPHFIVAAGTFDPTSGLIYSGIEDLQFNVAPARIAPMMRMSQSSSISSRPRTRSRTRFTRRLPKAMTCICWHGCSRRSRNEGIGDCRGPRGVRHRRTGTGSDHWHRPRRLRRCRSRGGH